MNSPNDNDQIQKRMSDSQRDGKTKKNPKNVVFNTSNVSGLKEKIIEHYSKDVKDI